jgi:flagellin-specific chaperone FliS
MNGHIKASSEILDRQIQLLFEVREAWAEVSSRNPSSPVASAAAVSSNQEHPEPAEENQTLAMSWSA